MVIADGECPWTIAAADEKVGLRKPDTLKVIDLARFPPPILFLSGAAKPRSAVPTLSILSALGSSHHRWILYTLSIFLIRPDLGNTMTRCVIVAQGEDVYIIYCQLVMAVAPQVGQLPNEPGCNRNVSLLAARQSCLQLSENLQGYTSDYTWRWGDAIQQGLAA
tara:strand:+ start:5537 stop:6028 length:492 start_codon:yes stop_codon:yes gene_type:complete